MRGPLFWAVFAAVLGVFFGFANPIFYFPPVIFAFLVGLNQGIFSPASPARVFRSALIIATAGYLSGLYWVAVPIHYYGHLPWVLAVPGTVLLSIYTALYAAAYVLIVYYCRNYFSPFFLGIFAGAVWACLECIRQWLFGGFPWLNPGSAFAGWPECIQSARLMGETGISAALVCMSMWLTRPKTPNVVAAIILAFLLFIPGIFFQSSPQVEKASILLVQGNIDQGKKWSEAYKNSTLEKYKSLTATDIKGQKTDLVVWPETAMPFYVQEANYYTRELRAFVRENNLSLMLGAPGYKMLESEGDYNLYNRAFLFNDQGDIQDSYDKMHLVPFGEYVPLKKFFPFLNKITYGVKDFSPGTSAKPVKLGKLALGVLICYEVIFPGQVQSEIESGANMLVNISNDAWFGRTSAPLQHLNMAAMRAVEQNRFMVRSTNTGISAFIAPDGSIIEKSGLFSEQLLRASVPVVRERTFFSRYFEAIHIFWFVLAALLVIYCLYKKRIN
ncbi:MAG: apolipoprotein N-acyltransferase [Thermodesulfobacteriota bacterium]